MPSVVRAPHTAEITYHDPSFVKRKGGFGCLFPLIHYYLLSTYYVLGTVVVAGDTAENKSDKSAF